MMQLEMYLEGNLVETTSLCAQLMKQASYLKDIIAELEKRYAPVLKKFSVKPQYCLCGVQSCMNNFVPLPSQISQGIDRPVETIVRPKNKLEAVALPATNLQEELPARPESTIPSRKVKAA